MLKSSDLFHLSYYNKAHFSGSISGMRYYIEKAKADDVPVFKVWVFPGPFCFEKTADDVKYFKTFDFAEESLSKIADWLNDQYEEKATNWNKYKSLIP